MTLLLLYSQAQGIWCRGTNISPIFDIFQYQAHDAAQLCIYSFQPHGVIVKVRDCVGCVTLCSFQKLGFEISWFFYSLIFKMLNFAELLDNRALNTPALAVIIFQIELELGRWPDF